MTPDPTTREGRDELRRLMVKTNEAWIVSSHVSRLMVALGNSLDALDAKDAEIERLKKLNKEHRELATLCWREMAFLADQRTNANDEITRLTDKLTTLRDGIAEVVATTGHWRHDSDAEPIRNYGPPASYGNYNRSPSPAGERLARLHKESGE